MLGPVFVLSWDPVTTDTTSAVFPLIIGGLQTPMSQGNGPNNGTPPMWDACDQLVVRNDNRMHVLKAIFKRMELMPLEFFSILLLYATRKIIVSSPNESWLVKTQL